MVVEEAATTEEVVVDESVSTEEETTEEEVSPLDMTDDSFMELMSKGFEDDTQEEESETSEEEKADDKIDSEEAEATTEGETEETETEESTSEETEEEVSTEEIEEELSAEETETEETSEEEVESEEDTDKTVENIIDASIQLEQIFEPFKANGKEMKVDNVDDARILMQMGANYNKKMAALKPNLKYLKMLENNNLLDENKLNYLIDLDKKNPGAITKLLKDSEIDPEKLDIEEDSDYKPTTYTVNDTEVELDETLNDIRDTESYAETLNIISNKWDETSKAALLANPAGIKILNEHVSMGIYEKISNVVATERMFNRIPSSLSDLEAYKQIGEAINAAGGFKSASDSKLPTKTVTSKTTTKVVDPKLSNKKKAASSTTGKTAKSQKVPFSPLAMSDAEFEKTGLDKFI